MGASMQDQDKKKSKEVVLKFNQIAVNQKYLVKNEDGKSLWDMAHEEYVSNLLKNPMYGGVYKYLPNEDSVIQSMLVTKHKQPFLFNRMVKPSGEIYTLDEINAMSEKERSALPLYKMNEEEARFYLADSQTKVLPRDDRLRVYKDRKDFDRDMIKVPLAEIVG